MIIYYIYVRFQRKTFTMRWTTTLLGLLIAPLFYGQQFCGPQALHDIAADHVSQHCNHLGCQGLKSTGQTVHAAVPTPDWYMDVPGMRSAIVSLEFDEAFPAEAMPAVNMAADIWAQSLESVVPITILAKWDSLTPNVLAQSAPSEVLNGFDGAPFADRQYAVALANQFAGTDLRPGEYDMVVTFGEYVSWYLGLDGNVPDNTHDMVTVALHEIAHGLGFLGSANFNGTSGFLGFQGLPFIYDQFVENNNQESVLDELSGTGDLGDFLTSDLLYWNGDYGVEGSGLGRPRLHGPASWAPGSSFSHLREPSYPSGDEHSLMTPLLNAGESIHSPGAIALGMMRDLGWELPPVLCSILDVTVGTQTSCNPLTNTYSQQLEITYENAPETGNLVVNGVDFPILGSPQLVSLSGLNSDALSVDVDVHFSENPDCAWSAPSLFTAPSPCCTRLRLSAVDPVAKTVTVLNVSDCEGGFEGQTFKSNNVNVALTDLLPADTTIGSGATMIVTWPDWPDNADGGDLTLFDNVGAFDDYVQWRTAGNTGQILANIYNLWEPGTFVDGLPPYVFEGDPYVAEHGADLWSAQPYPCTIADMEVGETSSCISAGEIFTQELSFDLLSPPAAGDSIWVHNFPLVYDGSNPWNVVLTLPANGDTLDITVTVANDPTCTATFPSQVIAPGGCACPTDLNGGGYVDVTDVLIFLTEYGCLSGCTADFNDDDIVNVADLLIFLTTYGDFCD